MRDHGHVERATVAAIDAKRRVERFVGTQTMRGLLEYMHPCQIIGIANRMEREARAKARPQAV